MKANFFYKLFIFLLLLVSVDVFCLKMPAPKSSEEVESLEDKEVNKSNVVLPGANVSLNEKQLITVAHPHATLVKKTEEKEEANIYLNFESASLTSVLNYLAEQKNMNILPHKDLEATKVSLTTRKPLTLNCAWDVLLTLLEMNGFSIVKVGDLFRIVSNKENSLHPLPTYSSKEGVEPENLPDSDLVVRYVYFFKNIRPDMAQNILSPMLEEGAVRINPDLQACILKEKCHNIKAAMKIIKELDTGGLRESIKIISLKHTDAEEVKELFGQILGEDKEKKLRFSAGQRKEMLYFSSSTRILDFKNRNALILLGTKKNLDRLSDFIYKYIDVPMGTADSRIHIREIRYAKAEDVSALLQKVMLPPSGAKVAKGGVVGKFKFFEDVTVVPESGGDEGRASGNRVIVACNQEDWKRIIKFIDKIDKPQPQVAFEVMILIVDETQNKEFGTQLQSKLKKDLGMGINRVEFANLAQSNDISTKDSDSDSDSDKEEISVKNYIELAKPDKLGKGGPAFLSLGKAAMENTNIWALIRSRYSLENSHIISQPYVITNNHQPCSVSVGNTNRVPGPLKFSDGQTKSVKTWNYETASTTVDLTPHINSDGVVTLEIKVNIDEYISEFKTVKRNIDTQTSLLAGQVLVLGGFRKSNHSEELYKTPIFGDIPILGSLFKNREKTKSEENLYVFIRPSIIKPRFEGAPDEYTQLKLDYAKYQILRNDTFVQDKDPIQRWFFRPTHYSVKRKLEDVARGTFPPIDDFTYGKDRPKTVDIKNDPYYRVSEALQKVKPELKRRGTKLEKLPSLEAPKPVPKPIQANMKIKKPALMRQKLSLKKRKPLKLAS